MDCSKKDVNGSIHKTKKWIVPQKQKMDRSAKPKNGSFHKNKKWIVPQKQKRKKSFDRETNGKVR
jgi:hypothetical protein